jgi:hypothetical protein
VAHGGRQHVTVSPESLPPSLDASAGEFLVVRPAQCSPGELWKWKKLSHWSRRFTCARSGDDSPNATAPPWRWTGGTEGVLQEARHGRCWSDEIQNWARCWCRSPPPLTSVITETSFPWLESLSNVASRGRGKSCPPAVPPVCILRIPLSGFLIPCSNSIPLRFIFYPTSSHQDPIVSAACDGLASI